MFFWVKLRKQFTLENTPIIRQKQKIKFDTTPNFLVIYVQRRLKSSLRVIFLFIPAIKYMLYQVKSAEELKHREGQGENDKF